MRTRRRRLGPVDIVALLVMVLGPGYASAQVFQAEVQRLLDNNCAGLQGSSGYYDSSLFDLCNSGSNPGISGGSIASQTTLITSVEGKVQARLRQRRAGNDGVDASGVMSADAQALTGIRGLGIFAAYEHERVDKDVTRFEPGFDSDQRGGMIGADYAFMPWLTAGFAGIFNRTDGEYRQDGGNFQTDAYGAVVYATITPMPNLFVDLVGGYLRRYYSIDRNVVFTNTNANVQHVAHGETAGDEYRAGVNAGYDFVQGPLTVGPRLGATYVHTTIKKFEENGGLGKDNLVTGLELVYYRQHQDSLRMNAGVFLSYAVSLPFGVLVPQFLGEYVHEFMNDQRVTYFSFREDLLRGRFRFQSDPPDRNFGNLSAGAVLVLPGGLVPFVNYRVLVGYEDRISHTITAGMRVGF